MNNSFDFNLLAEHLSSFLAVASRPEAQPLANEFRVYRRFLALIDSMTPEERRYPQTIELERPRVGRIAAGAGMDPDWVFELIRQFEWTCRIRGKPFPLALQPAPSVCMRVHRTMIAGRCPWCGADILHNEA